MKALILCTIIGLAACSSQPQPRTAQGPARDCFNVAFVQGYSSVGRNLVRLDAGPGSSYDVRIAGPQCDQIDWSQRIALESSSPSWICAGDAIGQGNIYFRDPVSRRRLSCYIEKVSRAATPDPTNRAEVRFTYSRVSLSRENRAFGRHRKTISISNRSLV